MTKETATQKAKLLLQSMTYEELAEKLGISRPTLYKRLADSSWKLGEISLLDKLK